MNLSAPFTLALLFDTEGFPPRWHCGEWTSFHGMVHVCADLAIFGAYAAIPIAITYFVKKRVDTPFTPIFWLFAAFILACGTGHLIEASIFWIPWYRFAALSKVITAIVSWATVLALIRILPEALKLPGLAKLNASLSEEIAERRKTEEELRRVQTMQNAILDSAQDAIISFNHEGNIVTWSRSAVEIFGYSQQEAMGMPVETLLPSRLHPHLQSLLAHTESSPGNKAPETVSPLLNQLLEIPAIRHDGSQFTAELFLCEISLGGQKRITGFLRDITARKIADEAERRIAAIVESSDDAIFSRDVDGTITSWNRGAEAMLQYPAAEVLGKPIHLIIPEDRVLEENQIMERIAQGNHIQHYETHRRRKDGTLVDISLAVSPIRDRRGQIVGASKIARDITERRQAEDQRQKTLERSEMLLREVHHRVKNNLQVVSSLLRLHAGKLRDSSQRDVFLDCRDRVLAMALIHERLYTEGQYAEIEFSGYLREMLRMILDSSSVSHRSLKLSLELQEIKLGLDVATPLSLITNELVLNVLKHAYTLGQTGTITIHLLRGDTDGTLIVQDAGKGFPPDFSPNQSTGIGLQLVESLTRQIRGTRNLKSGSDGTTFAISWPMRKVRSPYP